MVFRIILYTLILKQMKRYDVSYYENFNDNLQVRDIIIHAENDVECAINAIKSKKDNENGIKIDTKEKRNHILINLNFDNNGNF